MISQLIEEVWRTSVKTKHQTEETDTELISFYFYCAPIGFGFLYTQVFEHPKNRTEYTDKNNYRAPFMCAVCQQYIVKPKRNFN